MRGGANAAANSFPSLACTSLATSLSAVTLSASGKTRFNASAASASPDASAPPAKKLVTVINRSRPSRPTLLPSQARASSATVSTSVCFPSTGKAAIPNQLIERKNRSRPLLRV